MEKLEGQLVAKALCQLADKCDVLHDALQQKPVKVSISEDSEMTDHSSNQSR